jgi:hypothetical protein
MLSQGEWRPTVAPSDPKRKSYHISSLYPDDIPFSKVASEFLQSQSSSPEDLQKFVNSWLAEPFYLAGNVVEQEARILAMRTQETTIEVKEGFKPIITVDVQQDRCFLVVRAHGKNRDSDLIEHAMVPGFEEIVAIAQRLKVQIGFIDAGYRQQMVLEFCMKNPGWIPTIGSSGLMSSIRWVNMPLDGGLFKGKVVKTLRFRPDDFKDQLHERLNPAGKITPPPLWR